jgi:hypothetical protein
MMAISMPRPGGSPEGTLMRTAILSSIAMSLAIAVAVSAAEAQDFPKLKPGLWENSTSSTRSNDKAPHKSTLCLDDSVQQAMYRMSTGMMSGMCSKHDIKTSGNKVTSEAVCDLGGSKMQSKAVMTLAGNAAYRTEAHATFEPPFMGNRESTTVIEGKHVGPCKPGQKPGDLTLPGGRTLNIRQMTGAKG